MRQYKNESFRGMFRRSQPVLLFYRLFSFLFTLSCGYGASCMLDMAMSQQREKLTAAGIALFVLLSLGLPMVRFLSRWSEDLRLRDRQCFREELYRRLLDNRLEAASIGAQSLLLGQVSDQVAEHDQVRIPQILEGLCIALGATLLMCRKNLSLGILFSLMSLIQILPVFTYEKWAKKIYEAAWDNDGEQTDWITQGVDGIRTLKSYGRERWFVNRYQQLLRQGIRVGDKAFTTGSIENILYHSIDAFLRYGSYVILGLYVLRGWLEPAGLPVLVVLSGYVFSSTEHLFDFFRYRATYRMALEKLREALRPSPLPGQPGILRAEGITKSFEGKQVLNPVSLSILPRERVLLQGANGSGKTTLLRILLGELTPDQGCLHLGARMSAVLQVDPAPPEAASSFLEALSRQPDWHSDQFHTHLRGFQFPGELLDQPTRELSGGQRKKLFLAIALARDADLLVLDEPTNHLDSESRAYLRSVLVDYPTALLICTHDPELDLSWDQKIHLKGGEAHG